MNRRVSRWVGILFAVVVISAAPLRAVAGPSGDSLLELAAKGGPSVGLSLGVSPIHLDLIAPPETAPGATAAESRTLTDIEPRGRAVSFDITLKWPKADFPIQPYLVLGPALLVDQPQDLSSVMGIPADPVLRLGAKAGAGFNWRLGKDATFFGSYDVTAPTERFTSPGAKGSAAGAPLGYDLLYGVRFGF